MVTKGLDFDGVSVVGVLSADMLVNYPDFRSSERANNDTQADSDGDDMSTKRRKLCTWARAHTVCSAPLLGSASPSVETYHKALAGRYGLVELTERFGGVRLPEVYTTTCAPNTLCNRPVS